MQHPFPSVLPLYKTALDFVLPPRCTMCRCRIGEHGHLCGTCWSALTPIAEPRCERCALPFAFSGDGEKVCGNCIDAPPLFDAALAPVLYDEKGRDLVLALKHGSMFSAVPVMARMMAHQLQQGGVDACDHDMIMAVPLHWTRLLKRRFNQSVLLAQEVSHITKVPLAREILKRSKATPSQGTLGRKKRFANVKHAFVVSGAKRDLIGGKNIILVDDVLTTGATVSACAAALKAAGAKRVNVLVFARVGDPIAA